MSARAAITNDLVSILRRKLRQPVPDKIFLSGLVGHGPGYVLMYIVSRPDGSLEHRVAGFVRNDSAELGYATKFDMIVG